MSLNTANTPDGRGVLIFNGEIILLYIQEVVLKFDSAVDPAFAGKKQGNLYLTSHRVIFINTEDKKNFRSFSMPFHLLRNVDLEQPIFGANYLTGTVIAESNGNWNGEVVWRLTFNKGGCIDFGKALLKANELANNYRSNNAPPRYAPPSGAYFAPPPAYYTAQNGLYNGFQAPVNVFPDQPPHGNIFMYETPPPYPGIGPNQNFYQPSSNSGFSNLPPYPSSIGFQQPPTYNQIPNYNQANECPSKSKIE